MKFNSNYYHNDNYNHEKIKKIVEELMEEDLNPSLFDFLFRYNSRNYPETFHKKLDLPGKFKQIEDTAVFVRNNGVLQMDYAESVSPGGFVERDSALDVEHQTGILSCDKVRAIFNYCLYTTIQLKKPCYPIVVTNYDYGVDKKTYWIEGFSFTIYFAIYNEEKVYEILNNLSLKDYNNVEFSNDDYFDFIFALIFAEKHYAQDVVEKLAFLFASIEKIGRNNQLDLHLALKMVIKYRFKNDVEKIEELLTVITKAVNESRIDEISTYEVKQKSIEELKQELSNYKAELSKKDAVISQMGDESSKLKRKIDYLEKIIRENNIPL